MTGPLAISIGDPAGVGPELIAQLWDQRLAEPIPAFACIGSADVLAQAGASRGIDIAIRRSGSMAEARDCFGDALPVIDIGSCAYTPGTPDRDGARLALAALDRATRLTFHAEAGGLVTAPIAKAELARVGFEHPGQTEFVAGICGVAAQDAVMMLAGPSLKVVPITVHLALSAVPGALSADLIHDRIAIAARALTRDFGLPAPRIAVAGLNPHAGEQGRMGDEEARIISPALSRLREEGIDVRGPLPGDTMFHAAARADYDLAACMYHDQALIPLKALDFDHGVNVTLGLPIVRTSPDHGTAFAIAGTGLAHVGPMLAALRMADECAVRRALARPAAPA